MTSSETLEVAFVSDGTSGATVWDTTNGTMLKTYRHTASIGQNCMSLLGNDYLIAADKGPLIQTWPINSQERTHQVRMLCGGKINSLAASPDGLYIAVAISEKLQVWMACSGRLLTTVSRHFQPITIIKWSLDGSYLVTGGEDGLVCVWSLAKLVNTSQSSMPQIFLSGDQIDQSAPNYIFSDHSVRITGIYIGNCTRCIRIFTTSVDKTCKIYDLSTGVMLLSIAFDIIPSSLTVDSVETAVYIGTTAGPIRSFDLTSPPRTRECYISDKESGIKFIGHAKAVTALSVSLFGDTLVSGSTDCTIRTWHVASRQCLRTIQLKEPVINMFLTLIPHQLTANELEPSIILKSFKKTEELENDHFVEVYCYNDLFEEENDTFGYKEDTSIREELEKTKTINARIYEFALNSILKESEPNLKEDIDISSFSMVDLEFDGEKNGLGDGDDTTEHSTTPKKKKRGRKKSKKNVNDVNLSNIYKYS
ncbi:WD repeat-containing protein 18 [Rhopalosiphum padi]|uniref:WD repeat-containing protein 18 n=1 Tax=Rhopalosiphum padi TaxID=40932 RepID=UPI00298DB538|nr:WD repeat-containing protein 18 [Rhopalosiphum padi]